MPQAQMSIRGVGAAGFGQTPCFSPTSLISPSSPQHAFAWK